MNATNECSVFTAVNPETGREINLALQELWITGRIIPVGASLQVRHIFRCSEKMPVEVVYSFGLPRDAALRRFRIVGKGFSVMSDLKPTTEAVREYEKGIEDGSLSTLARQYRDGVINLNVGNIRPDETVVVYLDILAGIEIRDDGWRFRFPFTLAPSYHSKARAIEAEPGVGEMEMPEEFGDVILPQWMKDANDLHRVGFNLEVSIKNPVAEIGSPSHAIKVRNEADGQYRVSLATEKDVPNRDLVLDINSKEPVSTVVGGIGKDKRGHFAVVVPSTAFGNIETEARRIVFVLDRSGSMDGTPINQAKRALKACLGALSTDDEFGIVAFDDNVELLEERLIPADLDGIQKAHQFIDNIEARGGTELANGFLAAARLLRDTEGDVLVLTDGEVSGTETILNTARSAGIRIHALGIGSASQDRFLTLLARETGGISRFVTPRERVDTAAIDLFASIRSTSIRNIEIKAGKDVLFEPTPPSSIFAKNSLVIFGELRKSHKATITVLWERKNGNGELKLPINLSKTDDAETVMLLQGARLITDLESQIETVPSGMYQPQDNQEKLNGLEKLSKKYGLASRAMSLVAIVKRASDKPGELPKTIVVPVGMPQDVEFGAYFKGQIQQPAQSDNFTKKVCACMPPCSVMNYDRDELEYCMHPAEDVDYDEELLNYLAGEILPDGGLSGNNDEERWVKTAVVLFYFIENRRSLRTFRHHVAKMIKFLKNHPLTDTDAYRKYLVSMAEQEIPLRGDIKPIVNNLRRNKPIDIDYVWKRMKRRMI